MYNSIIQYSLNTTPSLFAPPKASQIQTKQPSHIFLSKTFPTFQYREYNMSSLHLDIMSLIAEEVSIIFTLEDVVS